MSHPEFEVLPMSAAVGAEICGVDLSRQVFVRLLDRGFIRRVSRDAFKGIWDVSPEGLDALCECDEAYAAWDRRLRDRRLDLAGDVYSRSEWGLVDRRPGPRAIDSD